MNKASKLQQVIGAIDSCNEKDPNLELDDDGNKLPKELLYSQRMSAVLEQYFPDASDHLRIAARAQHIERWTSKRTDYPEGRAGYKKWRAELGLFHASRTADCMKEVGYDDSEIDRVKYLVQKRGLKRDSETQALEDIICIVFLKHYLDDFAKKHNEEKLIDIIQKTWKKMSEYGHKIALELDYADEMLALIKKALA